MKYLKKFNESQESKFCGECGTKLNKSDTFCDQCGTKQQENNDSVIKGILKYVMSGMGSKSEGYRAYLELPQYTNKTTNEPKRYQLYRKNHFEIGDDYFKKFNNKEVVVDGEIQKAKGSGNAWIKVKDIKIIK